MSSPGRTSVSATVKFFALVRDLYTLDSVALPASEESNLGYVHVMWRQFKGPWTGSNFPNALCFLYPLICMNTNLHPYSKYNFVLFQSSWNLMFPFHQVYAASPCILAVFTATTAVTEVQSLNHSVRQPKCIIFYY